MSSHKQQIIKFQFEKNYKSEDFFVSKCNFFAFSLLDSWPKWEKNILNIHGEKYCGKSHLSEIFLKKNKGIILKSDKIKSISVELNEDFSDQKIRVQKILSDNNFLFVSKNKSEDNRDSKNKSIYK